MKLALDGHQHWYHLSTELIQLTWTILLFFNLHSGVRFLGQEQCISDLRGQTSKYTHTHTPFVTVLYIVIVLCV